MKTITEAGITLGLPRGSLVQPPTAAMDIFYNPRMASHRNITITLLNAIDNKKINLALPLAGSGIRALRFCQELQKNKINVLFVNDKNEKFPAFFQQNLAANSLGQCSISVHNEEASLFLLNRVHDQPKPPGFCGYFDYIDLDPFGTPNPFLAAAVARISRQGILAVTATDTAALTGTYALATKRKYWAQSAKNYLMHETGLRILIRKVQLQGIQFDKALIPILAYHKDHYFRIFFRYVRGKTACDQIVRQHQYVLFDSRTSEFKTSQYNKEKDCVFAGPLWTGRLFDRQLLGKMLKQNTFPEEAKFLQILYDEAAYDVVGFYDIHVLAKKHKFPVRKMDEVLAELGTAVRTHFSPTGIKTRKSFKQVLATSSRG